MYWVATLVEDELLLFRSSTEAKDVDELTEDNAGTISRTSIEMDEVDIQ